MNIDSIICYVSVTSTNVKTEKEVVVLVDAEDNGNEVMKWWKNLRQWPRMKMMMI